MKIVDNPVAWDPLTPMPVLKHGGIETTGAKDILTYLRRQNYGLEYGLTDAETVELTALVNVVERQLSPALTWFLWGEDHVFATYTRPCYITPLSYPARIYRPFKWRREKVHEAMHSQLTHCLRPPRSEDDCGTELYATATRCLTLLSYTLGKKSYFVADRPTAIDAYVFSHLWSLLLYESRHGSADWMVVAERWSSQQQQPSQSQQSLGARSMQNASHPFISHVLQCPNLVAHFLRILKEFFPGTAVSFRKALAASASKRLSHSSWQFTSHPIRDCLLAGTGVAILFLVYARSLGMIRIASSSPSA